MRRQVSTGTGDIKSRHQNTPVKTDRLSDGDVLIYGGSIPDDAADHLWTLVKYLKRADKDLKIVRMRRKICS